MHTEQTRESVTIHSAKEKIGEAKNGWHVFTRYTPRYRIFRTFFPDFLLSWYEVMDYKRMFDDFFYFFLFFLFINDGL